MILQIPAKPKITVRNITKREKNDNSGITPNAPNEKVMTTKNQIVKFILKIYLYIDITISQIHASVDFNVLSDELRFISKSMCTQCSKTTLL